MNYSFWWLKFPSPSLPLLCYRLVDIVEESNYLAIIIGFCYLQHSSHWSCCICRSLKKKGYMWCLKCQYVLRFALFMADFLFMDSLWWEESFKCFWLSLCAVILVADLRNWMRSVRTSGMMLVFEVPDGAVDGAILVVCCIEAYVYLWGKLVNSVIYLGEVDKTISVAAWAVTWFNPKWF